MLRFADLERDVALLEQARDYASAASIAPRNRARHIERWLGCRTGLSLT